ncbi:MAG: hypothetical protein AUK43_05260 [Oscillatoriales cyanobacterium CG2_30_40_61]|nr:MAG: hypothetical protein AUK43_05260 [Oscillatoriales cyanobacterium CG2_30_40_61]
MTSTSNFRQAVREARNEAIVGPNVIANALPYVGGGLILTALGTFGGLNVAEANSELFKMTSWVAFVAQIALFFVASGIANKGNNQAALPLLATYSLLTGYTLTGLVDMALGTSGVGVSGIGVAALGCGVTFIGARSIGSNLSESDGMALTKTIGLGLISLVVVMLAQFVLSFFGIITPSWLEIGISGFGVLLFVGAAVVDFYLLPRAYTDKQYLSAALSMYLTYINLFIFILRLLIAFNRD